MIFKLTIDKLVVQVEGDESDASQALRDVLAVIERAIADLPAVEPEAEEPSAPISEAAEPRSAEAREEIPPVPPGISATKTVPVWTKVTAEAAGAALEKLEAVAVAAAPPSLCEKCKQPKTLTAAGRRRCEPCWLASLRRGVAQEPAVGGEFVEFGALAPVDVALMTVPICVKCKQPKGLTANGYYRCRPCSVASIAEGRRLSKPALPAAVANFEIPPLAAPVAVPEKAPVAVRSAVVAERSAPNTGAFEARLAMGDLARPQVKMALKTGLETAANRGVDCFWVAYTGARYFVILDRNRAPLDAIVLVAATKQSGGDWIARLVDDTDKFAPLDDAYFDRAAPLRRRRG